MKYVALFIFNILAVYILFVFIFGNGGVIKNIEKSRQILLLEQQKAQTEIELEEMKTKWNHLKTLDSPDYETLASQGKKSDNMVIFKFIENGKTAMSEEAGNTRLITFRIYFFAGISVLLVLFGNLILCNKLRNRAAE